MDLGKIIQRVRNLYSKGIPSKDSRLRARQVYNKLLTVRSMLLMRELRKNRVLNEWNYQSLSCIELIEVNFNECDCLPPIGCKVLRSKYKLPKPLMFKNKPLLGDITTIESSISFPLGLKSHLKYQKGNVYTMDKPSAFIHNEYLFIVGKKGMKVVAVERGVYEDPLEVENFESYCKNKKKCKTCKDCIEWKEQDFRLDAHLIEPMIQITVEELIDKFNMQREDQTNNMRDNFLQQNK